MFLHRGKPGENLALVVEPDGFGEVCQVEPAGICGITSRLQGSPRGSAEVNQNIGRLAGIVPHPNDIQELGDLGFDTRFLENLPGGRVPWVLIQLLIASR